MMRENCVDKTPLQKAVAAAVTHHLNESGEQEQVDLYRIVLDEVEEAVLQVVIEHTKYNQTRASEILGLARGTLRNKLHRYFDSKYFRLID